MIEKSYDIPISDIKTIVDVEEYSIYYFLSAVVIFIIATVFIFYFLYKWFKNKNKYNQRKEYLKQLNLIDFDDTKKAAYAITKYGYIFKNDSEKHTKLFEQITKDLELYKYKKNVDKFDEGILKDIKEYKEIINV